MQRGNLNRMDPNSRSALLRTLTNGLRAVSACERRPTRAEHHGIRTVVYRRIESRNGVARIALSGEFDMATVPVLKEHGGGWGMELAH